MDGARGLVFARLRILHNSIAGIRHEPPLKIVFITTATTLFWLGALLLFHRGLAFFYAIPIVGPVLIDETLYIFFAVLFIMLTLSSVIVCHTTLFSSREVQFLFSRPVDHGTIYFYRLIQAGIFSSWAFLFLGIPFLIAYASIKSASFWFYLAIPAWFGVFVILPTALAAPAVLVMVRLFDYDRVKYFFIAAAALVLIALYWYYRTAIAPEARGGGDITSFMETFLHHLRILKHPFYPGYWMASSILRTAAAQPSDGLVYFSVYGATSLVALQVNWLAAKRLFYNGWLASQNRSKRTIHSPDRGPANHLFKVFSLLPRPIAALIIKDIRIFYRDFNQYSQFLLYLAILGVYIFNLRAMPVSVDNPYWKMIVVYLNLSATFLVLAGFSVRFLFPQVSLEGNKVWMLGLARVTFRQLVVQKFFFNFIPILLVSELLMVSTNVMLETSRGIFIITCSLAALASAALVGLALGLGSLYPNFKEDNPSRIVSGFGGTLNFIIALIYVMALVIMFALPYFAYEVHRSLSEETFRLCLVAAWVAAIGATAATCLLPLWAGCRHLERSEF